MNKKLFSLLIIFIATFSISNVCASEGLVSHDFGNFKMDIPEDYGSIFETHNESIGNASIYAVLNSDNSVFASMAYFDESNTNRTDNVTGFLLDSIKGNCDVQIDGNIISLERDNGEKAYLFSSPDYKQAILVISNDTGIEQVLNSISFT